MIAKPPGWPFLIVCSAAAAVTLLWASYPYWYGIEMVLLGFPVGFLLLAYWAIRVVIADSRGAAMNRLGVWIAPWFVAGGVMLALITDASFWIRFTLSEPSMAAYAKVVAVSEWLPDESYQWVGLYYVCGGWQHLDLDTGLDVPGSAHFYVEDPFSRTTRASCGCPRANQTKRWTTVTATSRTAGTELRAGTAGRSSLLSGQPASDCRPRLLSSAQRRSGALDAVGRGAREHPVGHDRIHRVDVGGQQVGQSTHVEDGLCWAFTLAKVAGLHS